MSAYLTLGGEENRISLIVQEVVKFYPYRTANAAVGSILEIGYKSHDAVDTFISDLVELANKAGIKSEKHGYEVSRDNHVVFEVKGGLNGHPFWIHISDGILRVSVKCEVGNW